ncbi:MAG: hypothetical protein ACTSU5_08480 [Promethearchaeota archaeon]
MGILLYALFVPYDFGDEDFRALLLRLYRRQEDGVYLVEEV